MSDGVRYIKIAKIDANGIDQTNTLQSLEKLIVPFSTEDIEYEILSITEKPTFFLYYVKSANVVWEDRADIKYSFSSSYSGAPSPIFLGTPQLTSTLDNQSFFLEGGPTSGGLGGGNAPIDTYRIRTYPQKDLNVRVSSSVALEITARDATTSVTASVRIVSAPLTIGENPGFGPLISSPPTVLATALLSQSAQDLDSTTFLFTGSYDLSISLPAASITPGDCIYFQIVPQVDNGDDFVGCSISPSSFTNGLFNISSSAAVNTPVGIIAEPYFGSNDFKRALDCQPLLNNAERVRKHNLFMDVDYSAGSTEPVNFDLIIDRNATKADVQFSNYTTRRHVIPRYEGSKSTSQTINKWSRGDVGTFGKLPTVESLKRMIAYSDGSSGGIGGWPPERMNASTIFIRYLIDENGDVKIPNTSENSLQDVQGTFQMGERVLISSQTAGSGEATSYRTIIRGGQRIEPILYTQSGSAPNAQFNTTMSFEDIIPSVGGNVGNYLANSAPPLQGVAGSNVFQTFTFNFPTIGTLINSSGEYVVPAGVVSDGISLTVNFKRFFVSSDTDGIGSLSLRYRITKQRGSSEVYYPNEAGHFVPLSGLVNFESSITDTITIPSTDLSSGDKIFVEFNEVRDGINKSISFPNGSGWLKVTQYPLPTGGVSSSVANTIWNWGDPNGYPYVITSSNSTLVELYNSTAKQTDIVNSGFNTVALPWSIKVGDEFRFEGREDFSFMVSKIFSPDDSEGRIFDTGSIEVHFNSNLPTGSSTSTFNLDNFLIRRYVDDPSQIIIEGFKPIGSSGPYIITPEYSTPKINKGIDEYITILTEKNLLS